jgi:CheY-like chemotaxis protein
MARPSYALRPTHSNESIAPMAPDLARPAPEAQVLPRECARRGQTVFVAEDDADLRLALGDLLSDEGFIPRLFPTASTLLGAMDGDPPALIVTDLVMPGMSGAQLLRALRDDERWRHIPVIVMTGSNDTALPLRLDAPIVYKPDTAALLDMIRTVVAQPPETAALLIPTRAW